MKSSRKYIVSVLVTGVLTMLFVSVSLFWIRWFPQVIFLGSIEKYTRAELEPSGLVPDEFENDPNVVMSSTFRVHAYDLISSTCGVYSDVVESEIDGRVGTQDVYGFRFRDGNYKKIWTLTYFDKKLGLLVFSEVFIEKIEDWTSWDKKILLYAGPEGISEKPDKSIDRFITPTANIKRDYPEGVTFYDDGLRRFFVINFRKKIVKKGPQIKTETELIQVGQLAKNDYILYLRWEAPLIVKPGVRFPYTLSDKKELRLQAKSRLQAVDDNIIVRDDYGYLAIDKTGTIYRLDFDTLELVYSGYLPKISPTATTWQNTPDDVLAYKVLQSVITEGTTAEHKGIAVATLSRDAMKLTVSVFDESGMRIKKEDKVVTETVPGGIAWMISRYLLENLQPPIFSAASYFTAKIFEASSGHKALFILPNSFVSMQRRQRDDIVITRALFILPLVLAPSFVLAIFLVWRIRKDAAVVGLSKRASLCWQIGTICFGLIAYITYRLTRPKETMVTCQNCGKLRRPDMNRCHRCGSKWLVPELTPPTWRVRNAIQEQLPK